MAEATETAAKKYSPKVTELIDKISGFTLMELSELVEAFEERFKVKAAAPMAMAAAGAAAAGGAAPAVEEEEAVEFDVVLTSFGDNKINVIKAVRQLTNLALKEAKQAVEGVPSKIKESLPKAEAEKAAATLKEAGAVVEIKPHGS